jgi:hypothetical protein
MKTDSIIIIFVAILCCVFLSNCEKESDPFPAILTAQQEAAFNLAGKWGNPIDIVLPEGTTEGILDNVMMEFSVNPSNYYPAGFTASNAVGVFEGTFATWSWASQVATDQIKLNNIGPVNLITITPPGNDQITVSFTYDGPAGGRTAGIGEVQFTLHKLP